MTSSNDKLWQYLRQLDPKPDKVLILVYGAGPFSFPEWQPILQAIDEQAVDKNYDCIGFVYADELAQPRADDSAAKTFRSNFRREIARERILSSHVIRQAERHRRHIKSPLRTTGLGSFLIDLFFALHLDDAIAWIAKYLLKIDTPLKQVIDAVYIYLYDKAVADKIRKQLGDALDEATHYKTVVLASHSLGTVIALDGLNVWKNQRAPITYWFTLGSPLSKIRRLRDDGTPNELLQSNVARWYNVYDDDDWIANVLGPNFSPQEIDTTNSTKPYIHDIFVNAGNDLSKAHAYYFNKPTQKLIASSLQ